MTDKRILYVDNKLSVDASLCSLPERNGFDYDTATNYLRALRKIESGKYDGVILRDLEIVSPEIRIPSGIFKYRDKDHLVTQGLPVENSLNFLRLTKGLNIPRIAILSNKNSGDLVRIVSEEGLAHIINEDARGLPAQIYDTLQKIFPKEE